MTKKSHNNMICEECGTIMEKANDWMDDWLVCLKCGN